MTPLIYPNSHLIVIALFPPVITLFPPIITFFPPVITLFSQGIKEHEVLSLESVTGNGLGRTKQRAEQREQEEKERESTESRGISHATSVQLLQAENQLSQHHFDSRMCVLKECIAGKAVEFQQLKEMYVLMKDMGDAPASMIDDLKKAHIEHQDLVKEMAALKSSMAEREVTFVKVVVPEKSKRFLKVPVGFRHITTSGSKETSSTSNKETPSTSSKETPSTVGSFTTPLIDEANEEYNNSNHQHDNSDQRLHEDKCYEGCRLSHLIRLAKRGTDGIFEYHHVCDGIDGRGHCSRDSMAMHTACQMQVAAASGVTIGDGLHLCFHCLRSVPIPLSTPSSSASSSSSSAGGGTNKRPLTQNTMVGGVCPGKYSR